MRRRCLPVLVAFATCLASAATVDARPREGTVAVISVEITGDGAPELRSQIHRSLAGGLASGGMRVVELTDVMEALRDSPELIGCTSTTCLQRIGEKVGAKYFARARVEATGSAYYIEIELLSAKVDGGLVTRSERSCPVCTIMEVNDVVSAAAKEMVELPPAKPMPVLIDTTPKGAEVRVDERDLGPAPITVNLPGGEHVVSASKDGFTSSEIKITVSESGPEPQEVTITLVKTPGVDVPGAVPDDRGGAKAGRRYRTWKWVAAGAAGTAFLTGITLVAIDGNDTCDLQGDTLQCAQVYDTMTTGIVSLGAAAALTGVSYWMFKRDRKDRKRASVAIVPTADGIAGFYRASF